MTRKDEARVGVMETIAEAVLVHKMPYFLGTLKKITGAATVACKLRKNVLARLDTC